MENKQYKTSVFPKGEVQLSKANHNYFGWPLAIGFLIVVFVLIKKFVYLPDKPERDGK